MISDTEIGTGLPGSQGSSGSIGSLVKPSRYGYGTSGFRFDESVMLDIAESIGHAIGLLLLKVNHGSDHPKHYGVMVTASHNKYTDNGVKIVNEKGNMLDQESERFMERIVNQDIGYEDEMKKIYQDTESINPGSLRLIIGIDTRRSSYELYKALAASIRDIGEFDIVYVGLKTTPELHVCVTGHNAKDPGNDAQYTEVMKQLINRFNLGIHNVVVDCANGVGAVTLQRINHLIRGFRIINGDYNTHHKLNNGCGSDYVMNDTDQINVSPEYKETLHASFDGDADRIVFYRYDTKDNGIKVMDGDYISGLVLRYIVGIFDNIELDKQITIGVIHTGYSNGGFFEYVDRFCDNVDETKILIERKCVATGVKNLFAMASRYDIGIYFESNGHGSVMINQDHGIDQLIVLRELFNQVIGDAIMNLLGVIALNQFMGLKVSEFMGLFEPRKSRTVKIVVKDKDIYKVNQNQTILIEPVDIKMRLESIIGKYKGCRAFVRPSGTEDILRLYVENNNKRSANLDHMIKEISDIMY